MNFEGHKDNIQNSSENIKTVGQLIEKLKSPQQLLEYMNENIEYGYVSRENNKIYSSSDVDFDDKFDEEYFLQTPEQLLNSKHGVCWDQVELERYWFSKQEYDAKVYFLMFVKQELNNLPTHTFLVYKTDDKFYWFENSFNSQKGIHEYEDFDALIEDIKKKHFDYAKKECGAAADDFKDIKICEYETPKFGGNPDEFMSSIIDNNFKDTISNK